MARRACFPFAFCRDCQFPEASPAMLPLQPAELLAWKSPRATGKDINKHQEVSKSTRSHRHHVDVHLPVFPGKILLNCAALTKRGRCAELQVRITEAVATATEQREMITRLEQHLSIIQSIQRPDAEGAAEHRLEKIPEPIKEATALFYGPAAPASGALPEGQVDSLLSIISSQREHFRARNQELEAENRLAQHTLQALQSELDSLRADNIKLFEKIKFLQSYPGRGSGSDDTELRYSSQYEERLDPFSSFSKRGRLVLSNKMACTIGFFYTLFLHCLVFLVLYKLAWSKSMERDCATFCAKKFADHLHKFHENNNGAAAGDLWQ
ncbi:protein CASP-like isoform X2 [Pan paniscus]|uniref:protein CASP-like isoform X2 n=1 Tax=Pan paniscus TaxID=9597 RepID=UPI002436E65A|nr:protein CASP-like isoform X2 [Pan paniscus]